MVSLQGKAVIITGASAGIGRATAIEFAKAGARVALAARRADLLETLAQELAVFGQPTLSVPTDVTNDVDLQSLVERTQQKFGRIDVLVNNAGLSMGGPFQEQDPAAIRQMVTVNVYSPMRLAQLVLPVMLAQRQGHIVNVASMAGAVQSAGQASYAPTRAAAIAFSHALRRELDGTGVRVLCVLPGWTATAMLEKISRAEMRAAGILSPFITLDPPEAPARAIVDAVRYNRYLTKMGGLQFIIGDLAHRLSPKLLDLGLRWYSSPEKTVEAMRNLGA